MFGKCKINSNKRIDFAAIVFDCGFILVEHMKILIYQMEAEMHMSFFDVNIRVYWALERRLENLVLY